MGERRKNSFWVWIGLYFLSLGGLPPFFGSALKILGVFNLSGLTPLVLIALIGRSLISLFYYLNMFFNFSLSVGGVNLPKGAAQLVGLQHSNKVALRSVMVNIGMRIFFIVLGYWFLF